MISVGLYPSRIQAEGFSIAGEDEGINCEGWELLEVVKRLFMRKRVKTLLCKSYCNPLKWKFLRNGDKVETK